MHVAFFLLLASSASRFAVRHGLEESAWPKFALCGLLALLYVAGTVLWDRLGHRGLLAWLVVVMIVWLSLVLIAPSFAWCAPPLYFAALRLLTRPAAVLGAVVVTAAVVFAQLRLTATFDLSLVLAPVAVSGMILVIFLEFDRLADALAATQRTAGILGERQRLSREIHDTLAQGLTSMGMLLQAADRSFGTDPAEARALVRRAADEAAANLDEARRFVRALAPSDLAAGSLPHALRSLADREGAALRVEGEEYPLTPEEQAALHRVAQGALANAREHAAAAHIVITLSYLDDEVALDVADDGCGFDPAAPRPGGAGRGYGLPGMRDRVAGVGGTLVVESEPGEGTVVAARLPRSRP
ncbi:sensor histidine kinase [Actinomadura harenae]|uniref:Oxygen sensor histidine kinase NreB n=2 Tax=Actinomadura harenae TaxID=2483351 RepID=A0A3M2MCL7_9ACTN|nr:sensor histidine kinase [Actinomadura harenae]